MPDTNTPEIELPPLPTLPHGVGAYYTGTHVHQLMQDYARAAILADRERHSQPVARVGVGPFALTKPWFEMIEGKTLPDGVHDLYTRPASVDAAIDSARALLADRASVPKVTELMLREGLAAWRDYADFDARVAITRMFCAMIAVRPVDQGGSHD